MENFLDDALDVWQKRTEMRQLRVVFFSVYKMKKAKFIRKA